MHGFIIQLSDSPIKKEFYITENAVDDSEYGRFGIDYVQKTNINAVDLLSPLSLPKGFAINKKKRMLEYDGQGRWYDDYIRNIQNKVQELSVAASKPTHQISVSRFHLQQVIEHPFFDGCLFLYTSANDTYGSTMTPIDLLELMNNNEYHKLYVGGCLDYHF